MQRRKAAHRQADHACFVEDEMIEHGGNIGGGALDRIAGNILRHVRRRLAVRVGFDASIVTAEIA